MNMQEIVVRLIAGGYNQFFVDANEPTQGATVLNSGALVVIEDAFSHTFAPGTWSDVTARPADEIDLGV